MQLLLQLVYSRKKKGDRSEIAVGLALRDLKSIII
jgi:hypothetical protein